MTICRECKKPAVYTVYYCENHLPIQIRDIGEPDTSIFYEGLEEELESFADEKKREME